MRVVLGLEGLKLAGSSGFNKRGGAITKIAPPLFVRLVEAVYSNASESTSVSVPESWL